MRAIGLGVALLLPSLAWPPSQAQAPQARTYEGAVSNVGALRFEVGFRKQQPFLLSGTMTVQGVEYRLVDDDNAKDVAGAVFFKVIHGRDKGERLAGNGAVMIEERLTGTVQVEGRSFSVGPRFRARRSYR